MSSEGSPTPASKALAKRFARAGLRLAFATAGVLLPAFLVSSILHKGLAPVLMLPMVATILLLTAFRPRWGFYATLGILPLWGWVPEVLGRYHFVPCELLIYSLLSGWLIHAASRSTFELRTSPLDAWLLALAAVVLSSMLVEAKSMPPWPGAWSAIVYELPPAVIHLWTDAYVNPSTYFPLRSGLNILVGMIPFFLAVQLFETKEHRSRIADILVVASLIVSIYGIFQYWSSYLLLLNRYVNSTLLNRNSLGTYLTLVSGIWAGQWMGAGTHKRFLLSVVLGPLVSCALWIGSRATWMAGGLILAALVFSLLSPARAKVRQKLVWCFLLVFVLVSVGLLYYASRLNVKKEKLGDVVSIFWYTLNPNNSLKKILVDRDRIWEAAFDAIESAPLTGIGIGRFYSSPTMKTTVGKWEHAHNYFLQLTAELGLIGLIVWLGLLGRWFWLMRHQCNRTAEEGEHWTLFGLVLGITASLIHWITDHPLLIPEQQFLFWCLLGLGVTACPAGPMSAKEKWCLAIFVAILFASLPLRYPLPSPIRP